MKKSKYVQLFCITHREYPNLPDNEIVTPVLVGLHDADIKLRIRDYYPNLSVNNLNWNELEAMYYIWHDVKSPVKGQYQYSCRLPLSEVEILGLLSRYRFIAHGDYVGNLKQQFEHYHGTEFLPVVKECVKEIYGNSISDDVFEKWENAPLLLSRNIFVAAAEDYDECCKFLFNVINKFNQKMGFKIVKDIQKYLRQKGVPEEAINYQSRVAGFISERLFTLYILWKFGDFSKIVCPKYDYYEKTQIG